MISKKEFSCSFAGANSGFDHVEMIPRFSIYYVTKQPKLSEPVLKM